MKKILCFLVLLGGILFFNTSVKAYDMILDTNGNPYNEEWVWNKFKEIDGFNVNNNKILCSFMVGKPNKVPKDYTDRIDCFAFTAEQANSMTHEQYMAEHYYYYFTNGTYYHISNFNFEENLKTQVGSSITTNWLVEFSYYSYRVYTNFDIPDATSSENAKVNKLNFEEYQVELNFDENLFANDPNFKKVCVNNNSFFSITKKHDDGVMSGSDHDFIWFPYGINGIKQFNYSTEMSNGYYEFENPYENFYFSSYDKINSIWNTEYMQDNFESKGYTDRYKYYGYTAYLFLHWYNFNDGQTYNFFPIFEVTDNVATSHISSSGNNHGGGGTRLDGDEEIEISNEYCFYIKNKYEVNEVILDEWGDHYVSVNTPNGPINYGTTINKDKTDTESFLSQPIKFISEMSGTITFLNANIYNLYMSMPLLVRSFLITALIIYIVILIMRLGGYQ